MPAATLSPPRAGAGPSGSSASTSPAAGASGATSAGASMATTNTAAPAAASPAAASPAVDGAGPESLGGAPRPSVVSANAGGAASAATGAGLSALGRAAQQTAARRQAAAAARSEEARTDAVWGEMQATLADVELSAAGAKTFFGPAHAAALAELRAAQVALAAAWARDNDDASSRSPGADGRDASRLGSFAGDHAADGDSDDDAEADMQAAARRRDANERYFERVGGSVRDVVTRLEDVAAAMAKVERESREVWSESEPLDSGTADEASLDS